MACKVTTHDGFNRNRNPRIQDSTARRRPKDQIAGNLPVPTHMNEIQVDERRDRERDDSHCDQQFLARQHCQYRCNFLASRTTSSTFGKKKCSSGGEKGTGVSSAVIRTMGPSRSSNASSLTMAASSPARPPVLVSSWRRITLLVFFTVWVMASRSSGQSVRRSIISISIPSLARMPAASWRSEER